MKFLDDDGNVDWDKVQQQWDKFRTIKESLANKHFTKNVKAKAQSLKQ
jgi:hypothetical protein